MKSDPNKNNEYPNCFHEIELDYVHLNNKRVALFSSHLKEKEKQRSVYCADYKITINLGVFLSFYVREFFNKNQRTI